MKKKKKFSLKKWLQEFTRPQVHLPLVAGVMEVKLVGDGSTDRMDDEVGITQERGQELMRMFKLEAKNKDCFHAMIAVSKHCTHQNELAFISFFAGKYCGVTCTNPFHKIFASIIPPPMMECNFSIHEEKSELIDIHINQEYEKLLLAAIEEETELSDVDFLKAIRTEYFHPDDGLPMVKYEWKYSDLGEEKEQSLSEFTKKIYQRFINAMHAN